jgi:hypothetical protein
MTVNVCLAALGLHVESTFGNKFSQTEVGWFLALAAQCSVASEIGSVLSISHSQLRHTPFSVAPGLSSSKKASLHARKIAARLVDTSKGSSTITRVWLT